MIVRTDGTRPMKDRPRDYWRLARKPLGRRNQVPNWNWNELTKLLDS